jgi:nucleoside-diphosphate kinase
MMEGNRTLTMIKPRAVDTASAGRIISMIIDHGFRISAMKLTRLTSQMAADFYSEHNGKPFYEPLLTFMSSGPIIVAILEKENAVEDFRALIGPTDPEKAADGTIRKIFGHSVRENAVHGSDCDESAERECNFFFSVLERY